MSRSLFTYTQEKYLVLCPLISYIRDINRKEYMNIDKNNEGAWRISENIKGYLETQVYYFYTKAEAIKKFRAFRKGLKI